MKKDFFPVDADVGEMVFDTKKQICTEPFGDGVLLLNINTRELIEINQNEYWVWQHFNGKRTVKQIAEIYSRNFNISHLETLKTVGEICNRLWKEMNLIDLKKNKQGVVMDEKKYIQNPDVNLREEDEDGALLFNPDTDQVKLLSSTGYYIWRKCDKETTVEEIIKGFKNDFEDVPDDQVKNDVEEFLKQMVNSGFIGIIKE